MTQNMPRDERTLARELADIKRRLRALETAPRAAKTSFSSGQLVVGDPASPSRIEISAGESHIRFNNAEGPPTTLAAHGTGGAILDSTSDAGTIFPFGTRALIWDGPYFTNLQVSRVDGDSATVQAEVYADVQDSGGGNSRATVSLSARGVGDSNGSIVDISADGGLLLYTNSRTTDPPAPPADCVVLYVKGNRLYYRDATGTVHGPL
ncbi:hypothetical protein [Actinoallomurus sp. CA-142502]|uniref:hypothetical protein n=1 Tax=Actinoallomurus sp. CA-142502 TaxID=3239885 RepID=UPI003D937437